MARIRTIKPDFWEDEKIGLLSHGARLLFLGCLNLSDDEGLLRWNAMYLGSTIFPYDDIKAETVNKWMAELEQQEIVFPYVGGQTRQSLGWIVNFHKHQRIDKPQPSKFPPPSIDNQKVQHQYFKRDRGVCAICNDLVELHGDVKAKGSKVLSLDHIRHRVNGGEDYPSNIRISHLSCNKSRGCKTDEEFHSENHSTNDSSQEGKGKEGKGNRRGREGAPAPDFEKKLELNYPFSEKFLEQWILWKDYKKNEFRFLFKSIVSEQASINELVSLANGNEQTAIAIIHQSMAKGWKGFFELKTGENGKNGSGSKKVTGTDLNQAFAKRYS